MSLPSLGRTQLQPVSPLVRLGPGGTAKAGQRGCRSVYLSISWSASVLPSPRGGPQSPGWKESSVCLMARYCMSGLHSLPCPLDPGRWLANDPPTGLWGAPRHFVS